MSVVERPLLDAEAFEQAHERVIERGELHVTDARMTAEQLHDLLAAAPRDEQDPTRRRLQALRLGRLELTGEVEIEDLVCDSLLAMDLVVERLTLSNVTIENETSIYQSTIGRLRWGVRSRGSCNFVGIRAELVELATAVFEQAARFQKMDVRLTFGLEAAFCGPLTISESRFDGLVVAHDTEFGGDVLVTDTTFAEKTSFGRATFSGSVRFSNSAFEQMGFFALVRFRGPVLFEGVRFAADAVFDLAVFHATATFTRCSVAGRAALQAVRFLGPASFGATRFDGQVAIAETSFAMPASFADAQFSEARQLGPLLADSIDFNDAAFARPVRIELAARLVSLERTLFAHGGDIFVRWAAVNLDEASFSGPSLLAPLPLAGAREDTETLLGHEVPTADGGWLCRLEVATTPSQPRVLSMRSTKVAQLTLSGVDLRACRFVDAHGLDGLRLEQTRFARTPDGWRPRLRHPRWTRRQTIAEEHAWRASRRHPGGWHGEETRTPEWVEQPPQPLVPEQIAAIYRALRKGREDSKDEPGAADFYYGEMEMRRHAHATGAHGSRSTRLVLDLYWLLSGYALRASRALVALVALIALLAVPLDLWGFRPDRTYGRALLFAAESSISLLRAPTVKLTASGEVVQLVLRIAGPLLFGLAALSLRGRVKR